MKISSKRLWLLRLLAVLAGLILMAAVELLLRWVPGLGPAPLVVDLAEHEGRQLQAVNRYYSQRFFFQHRGQLAAAGQMAERFFVEPSVGQRYRVVFVGASTVQGFPHPRRLAAASFLEAMLQDALPDREVEVVNLGITSIASFAVAQVVKDALALAPDLVVVYTGHNEFYGIYGVGDRSTPRYNRLDYAWRGLHLTHLLDGLVTGEQEGGDNKAALIELMARRGQVPLDSPRRSAALVHLQQNLRRISQLCQRADVPLVLCTLAANDAGFAPVGSQSPQLSAAAAAQWESLLTAATRPLIADFPAPAAAAAALEGLQQAAALFDESAWLWYLQGRALERLGRDEEAGQAFIRARDLDTMPWRAPSAHNEVIRILARDRGVVLADVEAAFQEVAPAVGVGWQLMVDHVHFSIPGQILLAQVVLDAIKDLAGRGGAPSLQADLVRNDDAYRTELGDLPVERAMAYNKMGQMLNAPPMDQYNRHNAHYLQQLATLEWQRLTPAEQDGIGVWGKEGQALPLVLAVADRLFEKGDFHRAQAHYRAARLEAPFTRRGDLWAAVQWAWCIKMQGAGFTPQQLKDLRAALDWTNFLAHDPALEPVFIDFIKGQLYHFLGEGEPALQHLQRAFADIDFRRPYLLPLFHALAAELVQAGRVQDARGYARQAGEEEGVSQRLLRLVDDLVER